MLVRERGPVRRALYEWNEWEDPTRRALYIRTKHDLHDMNMFPWPARGNTWPVLFHFLEPGDPPGSLARILSVLRFERLSGRVKTFGNSCIIPWNLASSP